MKQQLQLKKGKPYSENILFDNKIFFFFFYIPHKTKEMFEPIRLRSQLFSGNWPVDKMREIKLQATSEIYTGNGILSLNMAVRGDTGNVLGINTTRTTEPYEHRTHAVERTRKANNLCNPNRTPKSLTKHSPNLLLTVYALSVNSKRIPILRSIYMMEM